MEALRTVVETQGGLLLLLLLSPTIALGAFAFMWFKLATKGMKPSLNSSVQAIGQGIVLRHEYDSMLSAMRKEQRILAAAIHDLSERLARLEEAKQERERRKQDRRK